MTFDFGDTQALMSDDMPINVELSAGSAALALIAIYLMADRWRWRGITDSQWDTLEAQTAKLERELMANRVIGQVIPILTVPTVFQLVCDGSVYNRVDYPELYAALESEWIDGANTFHVPDLRNRFVVGAGSTYNPDDSGGTNTHTLTVAESPSHRHSYADYTANPDLEGLGVPDPLAVGLPKIQVAYTGYTGGGNSHENRPPYRGLVYVVIAR